MLSKCAAEGILSPWPDEVGLINAPVAMKRILLYFPLFTEFKISEQNTEPAHPQPEPPA